MRLVLNTPHRMVLHHRPVLLAAALCLGAVVLAGLAMWHLSQGAWTKAAIAALATVGLAGPAVWCAMDQVEVLFDRDERCCTISKRRLTGNSFEQYDLADVRNAQTQSVRTAANTDGAHRVAIAVKAGSGQHVLPLAPGYTTRRKAADLADCINAWLGKDGIEGSP